MHRFYLSPEQCLGPAVTFRDREARHAVQVLRLASGEKVDVLNGEGIVLRCVAEQAGRQLVQLRVVDRCEMPPLPWKITLLQAIPKARLMEDIIQKATELGACRIVPLLSERVVTRLDEESAGAKQQRWRQTAIEAIKQSGNPWLPQVEMPVSPAAFLERKERFDLSIIGSLIDSPRHLKDHVEHYRQQHQRLPVNVAVWIGPEGDFSPSEVALAKAAGALPISLGRLVLRCETAAIYCLSALNHELSAGTF